MGFAKPPPTSLPALRAVLGEMTRLGLALTRYLRHCTISGFFAPMLACYPADTCGFTKHVDQDVGTKDSHGRQRRISSILYLNDEWVDGDGGELRLHLGDLSHA